MEKPIALDAIIVAGPEEFLRQPRGKRAGYGDRRYSEAINLVDLLDNGLANGTKLHICPQDIPFFLDLDKYWHKHEGLHEMLQSLQNPRYILVAGAYFGIKGPVNLEEFSHYEDSEDQEERNGWELLKTLSSNAQLASGCAAFSAGIAWTHLRARGLEKECLVIIDEHVTFDVGDVEESYEQPREVYKVLYLEPNGEERIIVEKLDFTPNYGFMWRYWPNRPAEQPDTVAPIERIA